MSRRQEGLIMKELSALQERIISETSILRGIILKRVRRTVVVCELCKKGSRLSSWSFLQGWWYTPPRGCNDGDFWNKTDTRLCHIYCPKCGEENYICNHRQQKQITDLVDVHVLEKEEIFKEIWERHGRLGVKQVFPKP